jgi:hypothetical protein
MELLDRYLSAIGDHLPRAQKADVTAELRDLLLSQIEAEEARLGHTLTRDELEAVLIAFGHPLTVSGRYRKFQHLIGPEVFPFWWASLKMSLLIAAGVYLVLAVLALVAGGDAAPIAERTESALAPSLVFVFGVVTLVCALIERFGKTALLTRWRPRDLPPAHPRRRPRFDLVVEMVMGVVAILWWTGVIHFRDVIPETGLRLELAPVWAAWYWPILAYLVYEFGANLVALLRPGWVLAVEGLLLVRSLTAAAILGSIYQAGHWLVVSADTWTPAAQALAAANFDRGMRIGIAAAILVFLMMAATNVWRIWQATRSSGVTGARQRGAGAG